MASRASSPPEDDDAHESSLTPRQRRRLTRRPSDGAMIGALATSGLIAAFMQTLVTPVIPELPQLLSTSLADSSWVLTATLLAAAISTPISGRLGDMYGKRLIVIILLAIMAAGSVVCALSDTLIPMIVGRSLQGVGLGVIALGISILRDVIHPKNLGGAVAIVSATLGVGGAVGLPIAAVIAQNLDWHFLFWLAAVLSMLAVGLVLWIIPVSTLRTAGRFDFVGAVIFGVALVGILLAISKGSEWGWSSPLTLGMLVGGFLVLVAWAWFELRTRDPLIDLRVAARRPVLLTNLSSIAIGFAFFITTAALPVLLEAPTTTGVGLGQSLLIASLCLMPLGIVMFLLSPVAARLSNARGPRMSLVLGGAVIGVSFGVGALLMSEVWHVILISTLVGVGVGFAYAAMPTLIMHSVPPSETAAANGLNSVMRTLGSTVAASVVGVILSSEVVRSGGVDIPTAAAFQLVFLLGAVVVFVGVAVALFIPTRGRDYNDTASIPIQRG
ncbi:MFS transporter [Parafrigoribacterium soli]|uniref:MFS transporter n=1 Tax=Parafrigoribacterium soli TaxID=3144663 RepID=UPI0032EFC0A8